MDKIDRQELLQQKGCVIWITGLSGSGLLDVTSIMFYVYGLIIGNLYWSYWMLEIILYFDSLTSINTYDALIILVITFLSHSVQSNVLKKRVLQKIMLRSFLILSRN